MNSVQPLLAVIVPVYKVEDYLRPCVDSILSQSYTSLRVILVDDGSPDRCGEICDEYAKQDPRVQVVHKANGGQSSARNVGLGMLEGCSYVTFVDSDDSIEPGLYQACVGHLEQYPEVDIVGYGINEVTPEGRVAYHEESLTSFNRQEALREVSQGFSFRIGPSVWSKVFRVSAIGDVRFREGYTYEDNAFVLEVLGGISRYDLLPLAGYNYTLIREGSTTSVFDKRIAFLFDNLEDLQVRRAGDRELCCYANTMVVSYLWMYWYQLYRMAPAVYKEVTQAFLPYLRRARCRPYLNLVGGKVHAIKLWLFLHAPYLYTKLSLR